MAEEEAPGTPDAKRPHADETNDAINPETNDALDSTTLEQPPLMTATLKEYQLQGVQWMLSLFDNGLNGILADEMGLGKTIQTIAFIAHLKARYIQGPIMVVAPLSVLHNWEAEFTRFAPAIPTCVYHGSPEERARLREEVMHSEHPNQSTVSPASPGPASRSKKKRSFKRAIPRKSLPELNDLSKPEKKIDMFPIVLTTYDIVMRDRPHLSRYEWRYIIVDEGHRLKNMNCKLMREIKQYSSANRMILTGTPLQNNLAELWSLLNFILPDIFNDLDSFQERFNAPSAANEFGGESPGDPILTEAHSGRLITTLHGILKPFLLRRVKVDVEFNLPPKKEYVLFAPLTRPQVEIYEAILSGRVRDWLIENFDGGRGLGASGGNRLELDVGSSSGEEDDDEGARKMRLRRRADISYDVLDDDDEYFAQLQSDKPRTKSLTARGRKIKEKTEESLGREYALKQATKSVNNMKLQNTIMQLRKVCSHPYLFTWPTDPVTRQPILGDDLINASGKMLLLDRLLEALIGKDAKQDGSRPHKVLLFSQFVTMLDVIEDWAREYKGWEICRIDGSTAPQERREQMEIFNNGGNGPSAPRLFLLSTRSGGLGINLVEADTVIFYDQDWNPQMDLQAQDRAHRIGQTRPVLIFRLVANHTVETKIMSRAGEKRKLEALVIAKGKFRLPHSKQATRQESIAEMAATLLRLESEKIHVVSASDDKKNLISDEALEALLDRRPEVFEERAVGWKKDVSSAKFTTNGDAASRTAFKVFEGVADEANDGLAAIMGEDE
ncbi:uncharacterized protein EI90DRAFT_2973500 [Cantharellus anzutake]|uniref:uncharacterized protein n=1 Tax=Cantharellus anzutake TaxID=1750568 RepID=UPI001905FD52|nr:uncharacterized protein EI90DRAFT_2973500 [Cantharellus anzutake]KAF8329832.1 hypothetical protein EI90DRAFT_2973500 [Cantharellus anzutake]